MMFVGGQAFDLNVAVEQLTLLWANALGIDASARLRPTAGTARPSGAAPG